MQHFTASYLSAGSLCARLRYRVSSTSARTRREQENRMIIKRMHQELEHRRQHDAAQSERIAQLEQRLLNARAN